MNGPQIRRDKEPDDGSLIETGPSEIEIERRQAGVEEDEDGETAIPPEAEMPPD